MDNGPRGLDRVDTHFVSRVDPFGRPGRFWPSVINALLATALFRCWHLILFFACWTTLIGCLIELKGVNLIIQSTLITVFGTVLGFVISYRTSSSFERYNEGRKFWSAIILASRTFARAVWFHVPDVAASTPGKSPEEIKARTLIEKKTVLNLLEAFAVSVKHYLRGEDGTYYEDLYHLVRFLPAYDLPAGLPSPMPHTSLEQISTTNENLPLPVTSPGLTRRLSPQSPRDNSYLDKQSRGPPKLLPARNPPSGHLFDIFPFSLLVRTLTKKGYELKGKKAQKERAKLGRSQDGQINSHNIPLEITLYLSSYVAALQARKAADVPTTNLLLAALGQLADSLTGLERILTTPIPFSYSFHLWAVTVLYVGALPFQIWQPLRWVAIPATAVAAFIFFGFLACGEEIENPFGFDRNDLNLDHFTHNIIRVELQALTSLPVPDPAVWAFAPDNNALFDLDPGYGLGSSPDTRLSPEQWVKKGVKGIRDVLASPSQEHLVGLPPIREEKHTAKRDLSGGGGGGGGGAAAGGGAGAAAAGDGGGDAGD